MCELSAADGFVEINENLGDMIKYVVNEPSVGLYYIQLHAQQAVPNVVRLKNTVREKSQELSLHTEDLEDSIAVTRSMKQCGFPIIDEMIADINTSLTILSTKQPVRGVIQPRSSSYQMGGPSSWGPVTSWARSAVGDGERGGGSYLTNVLKTAKEKAVNLKWPPLDLSYAEPRVLAPSGNDTTQPDEGDELPLSSPVEGEILNDGNAPLDENPRSTLSALKDYDEFKAHREARLEEWLKGNHHYLSL